MNDFKIGDGAKCLDNKRGAELLTVGKVYPVGGIVQPHHINILNDEGYLGTYDKACFEVCAETAVDDVVDVVNNRSTPRNKYDREIVPGVFVDVYQVLRAWNVTDPCLQHLLKKALAAGERGHKDLKEDLEDILKSAKRAVEIYNEWNV